MVGVAVTTVVVVLVDVVTFVGTVRVVICLILDGEEEKK